MATIGFHRPARRFPQSVPSAPIELAAPPQLQQQPGGVGGAIQTVVPMLGMVGGMSFILFVPGQSPVLKWVMGGMCGLMVAGGLMTRWFQTREARAKKKADSEKYNAYLDQQTSKLEDAATLQRAALVRIHPAPPQLMAIATTREQLWERRTDHPDFLHGRVGLGGVPLAVPAKLPANNNPLTEFVPELHRAASSLVSQYTELADAPFVLDLKTLSTVAIIGNDDEAENLARTLVCHLATTHGPSELVIAAYFPESRADKWMWMKWLPHCKDTSFRSNGSGPRCFLAETPQALADMLSPMIQERQALINRKNSDATPDGSDAHLLLLVDGFAPRTPIAAVADLNRLMEQGKELHATVLTLVHDRHDEPAHVSSRVEVDADGTFRYQLTQSDAVAAKTGTADNIDVTTAEAIARSLAPLRLRDDRDGSAISSSGNLFTLLGLSGPDAVDPARTWKSRQPSDVMQVPLGVRSDGDPLILDLKEAAVGGMGPHGLIVGATGSGKSELLRTFVTGLAVNHSSDILSFVFVDFKGGAAFADLAELPHVAGMITNLAGDLSRVDRMYSALVGEQERRQQLLREAGNVDGIKEYQALYARKPQIEPMPYLVLVVDEFGELLVARPDFLDLFNAIGRVGRSLGMHLVLASQRLEEGRIRGLEGHLRYRICLRTFSAADSQTVLGTQDAYHLPSTPGAGYFKVDTTIYHRFQTAHVSASYSGPSTTSKGKSSGHIAEFQGLFVATADSTSTANESTNHEGPTEMEVAIRRLRERSRGLMRPVHQVWLPPLGTDVTLGSAFDLAHARTGIDTTQPEPFGQLRSVVGVLDIPAQQTQEPMVVDFSGASGHLAIAGAPQTGKSTFLRSLISSYTYTHSPQDVQFYCIDLGGGSLHAIEDLPHVGSVCGKLDRDKVRRLIREMHSIVEERELAFRRNNIDSVGTYRRKRRSGEIDSGAGTDVFLVIDNWGQFRADFDDLEPDIAHLIANGLAYGVHVVITANRWADLRAQIKDNIGFRLEFRLNDPTESEMPRGASKTLPTNIAGRGINQQALHFQIALPSLQATPDESGSAAMVTQITNKWTHLDGATPIRLLPSILKRSELPDPAAATQMGVPLGIDEFRLQPVWIDLFAGEPHFLLIGDSETGKSNLIRVWMEQLMRRYSPEQVQFVLVDYRRALLDAGRNEYLYKYAATPNLTTEALDELRGILLSRLPGSEVTREQLVSRSWWSGPEYVIFVDDYDLVVSPTGNPISALTDLLPQGRDVGMHLVLSRRVGGMARSAFESVLQRVRELGTPGLILSGDPQEGPILGTQKAALQPAGRGFLVRRGQRTMIIQTALGDEHGGQ